MFSSRYNLAWSALTAQKENGAPPGIVVRENIALQPTHGWSMLRKRFTKLAQASAPAAMKKSLDRREEDLVGKQAD